jgi:hypothetical protein
MFVTRHEQLGHVADLLALLPPPSSADLARLQYIYKLELSKGAPVQARADGRSSLDGEVYATRPQRGHRSRVDHIGPLPHDRI